jgi:putative colanic acid biosynthesis acetyltransferase WcaF
MNLVLGAFLNFVFNEVITHIPAHWLRLGFLRLFNRKIHGSCVILMHVRILNFWNVKIGERVVINQYCMLDCRKYSICIAHDSDLGPYTRIWTLEHDPHSPLHALKGGDVIIEDHVWVASSVTILPGIIIGRGAVLASACLVTKSVLPMDIIGGIPGKTIGKRSNDLTYSLKYVPLFD